MDIRDFISRLKVESGPNGQGEYMCRCPAHDDKNASLCVKEGSKGIVLKCQAGCATDSVLSAMGLKMADLFYESRSTGAKAPAKPAQKSSSKKSRGTFVCAYRYTDENGKLLYEACRYRRDDGSKTFLLRQPDPNDPSGYKWTKEGVRLVLYRLPEVLQAIREGKPVFICEGEKDCDNMAKLGYVATTNPMGAGKWHIADYASSLKGADVYVIPDNDKVGNDHAATVAQDVAKVAKSVHEVFLTRGADMPEKGDVTDFFEILGEKEGRARLEKLMREGTPVEPEKQTERDTAAEYYAQVYGYSVSQGRICQETADGPKPLANFVAIPRAVVAQDDGVNVNKVMIIDGWDAQGTPLPRVQIKAAQFSGMNWVAEKWDFAASIMPGNTVKDKIRYAISEVGRMTAKRITEYSHTGWRQISGKWCYLYQGGAIGADDVTVDLGSGLSTYRLDGSGAEGWDKLSYQDGAAVTLGLKDVIAEHIAIPLLGTIFLAPLREFLAASGIAPAYALFLLGGTGTRKSSAAALALSHFGNFTSKSLPASFNDTANFIRKKAFLLKDAPIVVDDYHPVTSLQERKKMEATAQSLARAFGDGAERGRMKADLTLQEAMPPRGIAIISGEDTPGVGESGMARFYIVNVGKGDVPATETLTEMQELARQGYLQKSMRGYIVWLSKQVDELPKYLHDVFIRNRAMALEKTKGQHGRTAEAIAHMMVGYQCMLNYLRDVQVITTEDAQAMYKEGWDIVTDNSARQAAEMKEDRPSKIFLSTISELLISKSAGVKNVTSDADAGTGAKDMIGYVDNEYYYLMPNVAYRAVAKLCSEQGQAFPLTAKMLYKQMREDGILGAENTTSTSATRPKWIDGRTQRLLWIPRKYLDGVKPAVDHQEHMDFTEVDASDLPEGFE